MTLQIFQNFSKRPQEQTFWKRIGYVMILMAVGYQKWWKMPQQPTLFQILNYMTVVLGPTNLILQVSFLVLNGKNYPFFQQGNMFSIIVVSFDIIVSIFKYMCN